MNTCPGFFIVTHYAQGSSLKDLLYPVHVLNLSLSYLCFYIVISCLEASF